VFYVALRRMAGNRPLQQHGSHTAPLTQEVGPGAVARPVLAAPRGPHE
jgi:multidrug efflux pump